MTHDRFYADMADAMLPRESRFFGLNDPKVASLRCFMRYHKDARVEWRGDHWMTHKQMRVFGALSMLMVSGSPSTIRAIALECQAAPSTVSRAIIKFQAWGEMAVDIVRGKYGGIRVYSRQHDRFGHYKAMALAKLRKFKERAFNVASTLTEKRQEVTSITTDYGRNIKKSFAEMVVYERAYLALSDPDGEYEARRHITREEAIKMLDWKERPTAEMWAQEEQRILDKAMEEKDITLVHRINVDRIMREHAIAGRWDKWQALADLLYPEHVHS